MIDASTILPSVLPPDWRLVKTAPDGATYRCGDGLAVIASVDQELDGKLWLHVSLSRAKRLPSYEDMTRVKRLFIGRQRYAYEVHAPEAKHVNIHPFCLHLWCCLDGPVLPDFTRGGGTI